MLLINDLSLTSLPKAVVLTTEIWQKTHPKHLLTGIGNSDLLDLPMNAFFTSRQCSPHSLTRGDGLDFAADQRQGGGGQRFSPPLDLSVLKLLLQARSPVVAVLARPVAGAKLPLTGLSLWRGALWRR